MPYIKQEDRNPILKGLESVPNVTTPGQFNYMVTVLAHRYLKFNGENYQHYNDLIGALEGIKLELYRRQVAPYEDKKIHENGDV